MKHLSDTLNPRMSGTAHLREAIERVPMRSAVRLEDATQAVDVSFPLRTLRRDVQYMCQSLQTSAPLWMADQLALAGSLLFAGWVCHSINHTFAADLLPLAFLLILAFTAVGVTIGLYPGIGLSPAGELRLTTIASTVIFCILLSATRLHGGNQSDTIITLACSYAWCLLWLPIHRVFARRVASRYIWWKQPALVFGGPEEGASAYRALLEHPQLGLRPVGLLDDRHHQWLDCSADNSWPVAKFSDAHKLAESRNVFWGIVAMPHRPPDDVAAVIDHISITLPNLLILPAFSKVGRGWDGAHDCGGRFGVRCTEMLLLPIPRLVKRTMDLAMSTLIVALSFPLMLLVAAAIKLTSPGPLFYRQTVPGVNGRRFCMWKFRTMYVNGSHILEKWLEKFPELQVEWDRYHKLRNDPRVTPIGRFLRRTSLDELPQLFNVLCGEMSLVGPRPYPLYECDEMQAKAPLVLRIRPGITGLWQVSGRSNMTFEQRLIVDTKYVRNWSLWIDLGILAKTLVVVLRNTGAY